jgi:hypothetical protein
MVDHATQSLQKLTVGWQNCLFRAEFPSFLRQAREISALADGLATEPCEDLVLLTLKAFVVVAGLSVCLLKNLFWCSKEWKGDKQWSRRRRNRMLGSGKNKSNQDNSIT